MPAHSSDGSPRSNPNVVSVACPQPVTPSLHSNGELGSDRDTAEHSVIEPIMTPPASDNTAAGMSMLQEDSMYTTPDAIQYPDTDGEKDKADVSMTEDRNGAASLKPAEVDVTPMMEDTLVPENPASLSELSTTRRTNATSEPQQSDRATNTQLQTPSPTLSNASVASVVPHRPFFQTSGSPTIDLLLSHTTESKPWEFSKRKLQNQYPSALFQTNSKYTGTQQSDRQIYNVEVTILTVDMDQCTTSGYLQICGLTPDHPTLTTFFTGEVIGGPDQKFSFRTRTSEWGATDKTDMTHWARFPAWRSLSSQAKHNLNFVHPSDQSPWWQQENIFMRWKEHFLVPDYKLRSIQGASFEGFYYICLNQIEGKISGIYFHSKSEK